MAKRELSLIFGGDTSFGMGCGWMFRGVDDMLKSADLRFLQRVERFGFVPDPAYPTYPFHPDSVHCACAKLLIRDGRVAEYRLIPMLVEKDGVPYVRGDDPKGRATLDYLRWITAEAGLNARYRWTGDEIQIY